MCQQDSLQGSLILTNKKMVERVLHYTGGTYRLCAVTVAEESEVCKNLCVFRGTCPMEAREKCSQADFEGCDDYLHYYEKEG